MRVPDINDELRLHEAEQEAYLESLPKCFNCGEPIQEEYCYEIDDELYCEECMKDEFRVCTANYER